MAETRAYLRAFTLTHAEVGEVVTLANRALASDLEKIRGVIDVDVSGVSVTKAQKKA